MSYGTKQYKQTQVTTASRGQILIMLYEAGVRNVRRAVDCLDKNDVAGKGAAIVKAHDIVNELANTLDHKIGGKISEDLERLYNFMIERLVHANAKNDKKALQEVQKLLEDLLSAWRVAVKQFESQQGNASGGPNGQQQK